MLIVTLVHIVKLKVALLVTSSVIQAHYMMLQVPELVELQKSTVSGCQWLKRYLLETLGFAVGILTLTIIAVFEERIKFA